MNEVVKSLRVRLRSKRGRGWDYQEIQIPTDAEMERLAGELHAKREAALITVLGWKVFYRPSETLKYSDTEVNPFTGEFGRAVHRRARTIASCTFGHGAEWQVCYSWNEGDERPPIRIQERGEVVPLAAEIQGTLF